LNQQSAQFLNKAHRLIASGNIMLAAELWDASGRNAYLAAFHAAQAYIFEKTEKILKTHNGVRAEFLRLTKDLPERSDLLRNFLAQSYGLKTAADYDTEIEAEVSPERATRSLIEAKQFLAEVERLII